jgi:hypothetical protein
MVLVVVLLGSGPLLADEIATVRASNSGPPAVDWFRAGILVGVEPEDPPTTFKGGFSLSLFGLAWQHVYLVPVASTVTMSGNALLAFSATGETGWLGRWGDHQLRAGVGLGFGFNNLGASGQFLAGAAIRPAVRYRHYWGRFGLEVSVEVPLVVGPGGGPSRARIQGWSPLLGLSFGL